MTRQVRRRPIRRPSRDAASRRLAIIAGSITMAAGAATMGLSALAAIADPNGANVAAFGTLVVIGALAAIGGLVCALDGQ